MANSRVRGRRLGTALGAAVLVAAVAAASAASLARGPRVERHGVVYVVRSERAQYRFDPVFRTESLDGVAHPDPAARDAQTAALRAALLRHLGVRDLQEIPQEGEAELRALKALGYL